MKKLDLQKIIREEIKKALTEAAPIKLKLGEMYQIFDPGMNEWNDEYEYLGFDTNSREYMFRAYDSPVDYFHFVGITKNELARSVRESLM